MPARFTLTTYPAVRLSYFTLTLLCAYFSTYFYPDVPLFFYALTLLFPYPYSWGLTSLFYGREIGDRMAAKITID